MSERQFWRYLGVTAAVALLLGAWLVSQRSGLTIDLMLAGAFFVLFYTWPLKYIGLGELSENARPYAAQHRIAIWGGFELAQAFKGPLPAFTRRG